jgi:hypothetical protein
MLKKVVGAPPEIGAEEIVTASPLLAASAKYTSWLLGPMK